MRKLFKNRSNYKLQKLQPSKKYRVREPNIYVYIEDEENDEDYDDTYYLGYRIEMDNEKYYN